MVQGKLTHPDCYFAASACAALVNFPLWRMSAQAQSGFVLTGPNGKPLGSFAEAVSFDHISEAVFTNDHNGEQPPPGLADFTSNHTGET